MALVVVARAEDEAAGASRSGLAKDPSAPSTAVGGAEELVPPQSGGRGESAGGAHQARPCPPTSTPRPAVVVRERSKRRTGGDCASATRRARRSGEDERVAERGLGERRSIEERDAAGGALCLADEGMAVLATALVRKNTLVLCNTQATMFQWQQQYTNSTRATYETSRC